MILELQDEVAMLKDAVKVGISDTPLVALAHHR